MNYIINTDHQPTILKADHSRRWTWPNSGYFCEWSGPNQHTVRWVFHVGSRALHPNSNLVQSRNIHRLTAITSFVIGPPKIVGPLTALGGSRLYTNSPLRQMIPKQSQHKLMYYVQYGVKLLICMTSGAIAPHREGTGSSRFCPKVSHRSVLSHCMTIRCEEKGQRSGSLCLVTPLALHILLINVRHWWTKVRWIS